MGWMVRGLNPGGGEVTASDKIGAGYLSRGLSGRGVALTEVK
jgi:hypothetical protein